VRAGEDPCAPAPLLDLELPLSQLPARLSPLQWTDLLSSNTAEAPPFVYPTLPLLLTYHYLMSLPLHAATAALRSAAAAHQRASEEEELLEERLDCFLIRAPNLEPAVPAVGPDPAVPEPAAAGPSTPPPAQASVQEEPSAVSAAPCLALLPAFLPA
jgi:hypothetical protein